MSFPGLGLRKMGDPNTLPPTPRASLTTKARLKENLKSMGSSAHEPVIWVVRAHQEAQKLAVLAGVLSLTAIAGAEKDPTFRLTSSEVLFDTGAHISIITEDVLRESLRELCPQRSNRWMIIGRMMGSAYSWMQHHHSLRE